MRSLRRTLSVRFSATMLVALAGIAVWTYLGIRRTMYRQLDDSLQHTATLQVDLVSSVGSLVPHSGLANPERFVRTNRVVSLRDSSGRVMVLNAKLQQALPLDARAFAAARRGQPAYADEVWGDDRMRSLYAPAPSRGGAAVLEVATSTAPLERDLDLLALQMLATVLLASLATFIGADWLAARSLEPLQEVLRQARAITGRGEGERITVDHQVRECQTLVAVLNDMLERVERAHTWHRRIMRDLGHDLRTPITAMRASVEVALWSDRKPDEYRRVLAGNMEEIERLTLISDALVLLGRFEFGDLAADRSPVDLRSIAADAMARVQQRPVDHVFVLARSHETVPVLADRRLIGSAIDQLLDNAIQHTPPGTTIHVSVDVGESTGVLIIEDNGPGVPDHVLAHIFERFYRGDSARGRGAGPGLGLTLVAAIVSQHQGTIRAERSESGGLRIRIQIPLDASQASRTSAALQSGAA
jgi:two-component system heavy metal sensor histidine kinase CusS